jgi:hypothetical protein
MPTRLNIRRLRVDRLEDRTVPTVAIAVNAALDQHSISPLIYGTAFASSTQLSDLNAPYNRSGGNTETTYNWQANAANHANDWYFESLPEAGSGPSAAADQFVSTTLAGGAQPTLTVPTIGWVAKLGPGGTHLASFPASVYPSQQAFDPYWSQAGNGKYTSGANITGNDPNLANQPSSPTTEQGWISHLVTTFGSSSTGGVKYYTLDNEPSIWHDTHRDIHPNGAPMAEVRDDIINYAAMIRSVDPNAMLIGPEEWGWSGYWLSGEDQQYGSQTGNWSTLPDKTANGGWDYMPWVLNQLHTYDQAHGTQSLNVFSLHYYPQGNEFSTDVSQATELLRNQSTRSLWDPTYVDQSWIGTTGQPDGGIVKLIPLMKSWVSSYYPGLKTDISEYNWGAEGNMNGATTQADIYGIFGREGLDMANRWTTPATNSPTYLAMKMYRNYDGLDGTFGQTNIRATVPNPDQVSAFASLRADGALTVMVINKNLYSTSSPTTAISLNLSNFAHGSSAQLWQLAATNPSNQTVAAINHLANVNFSADSLSLNVPAESVSMFVIPSSVPPTVASVVVNGGAGQRSEVRSIAVTFSNAVSFTGGNAAAAFQLTHVQDNTFINNLVAGVSTNGTGQTVVTLTFSATGNAAAEIDPMSIMNGGAASLADGRYQLTILAGNVTGGNGLALDGDNNGSAGGNYVSPTETQGGSGLHLYRLFGDATGDGVVDLSDLTAFRGTYNAGTGNPAFLSYLDADNSGVVDLTDLTEFRNRYNHSVF